ncbi:MAG: hypothetical protein ACC707_15445 [Thiohalomonadales bacterium]
MYYARTFCLGLLVFIGQSLLYPPFVLAAKLSLPSGDLIAPEVTHEVISEKFTSGVSAQIKATVTDNVGVNSVILFYRTMGSTAYKRIAMIKGDDSDSYLVRLGYDEVQEPGIEYYIQAADLAGNTLLYGYSFSPLVVGVAPVSVPESSTTAAAESETPVDLVAQQDKPMKKSTKKWLWIGLGVLAAGAIIASNNGSDDPEAGKTESGAITITGPPP